MVAGSNVYQSNTWKKNLMSRKSPTYKAMQQIIYWRKHTNPNDIDSKRTSSRFVWSKFASSSKGFVHALRSLFCPFKHILFKLFTKRGYFIHQNYAVKSIGHHVCLRENGNLVVDIYRAEKVALVYTKRMR